MDITRLRCRVESTTLQERSHHRLGFSNAVLLLCSSCDSLLPAAAATAAIYLQFPRAPSFQNPNRLPPSPSSSPMTAWISSPMPSAIRTAFRALDFLIDAIHHETRSGRRSVRGHSTASSPAFADEGLPSPESPKDNSGDKLLSRISEFAKKFSKTRPNSAPESGAKPRESDPFHYNTLMKAFSRAGNISEVLRLYHEMKQSNAEPDIRCYTTVINGLVAANRPAEAEEVFGEMIDSGVEPDTVACTVMVKLYACYLKRFDSAYEVIRWMARRGCDPDVVTYSTLITGLCRAGRVTEAWGMLDQMFERKCTPNAHCYSPILWSYCSEVKIDAAKRLMESMQNIGCSADAVTYNILIDGLWKIGKFDEVENLLKDSVSKGWKPNVVTYNTYMNGLCKVRKAEKAFEQLEIMLGKGLCPTTVTLNILLDSFCQDSSKVLEGKYILEKSSELGLEVDVVSYNIVMSRLCKNGEWLGVLKLFADMLKKGIRPDTQTFNVLVHSLCKGGKFRKAICIFRSKGFVADIVTCNILIHEFYMAERINELCLLFSNLDVEKNTPDIVTYNTLVDCLCRNGKFLEAVDFVRSHEDGFPSEPVAHLAYWLVRGGKLAELLRVLEEMSKQGLVLDVQIFNFLIKAFCRIGSCQNGEITEVSFILEKMLGIG